MGARLRAETAWAITRFWHRARGPAGVSGKLSTVDFLPQSAGTVKGNCFRSNSACTAKPSWHNDWAVPGTGGGRHAVNLAVSHRGDARQSVPSCGVVWKTFRSTSCRPTSRAGAGPVYMCGSRRQASPPGERSWTSRAPWPSRREPDRRAGRKDARGITRQILSVEGVEPSRIRALDIPRLRILDVPDIARSSVSDRCEATASPLDCGGIPPGGSARSGTS